MKPNFGLEPHLDQAAMRRAFRRWAALPRQQNLTIDSVDVGRTRLDCAPIPPLGETLPGTLGPPTARQIEGKYDLIRESNPDGVTEVLLVYTYPEEFGVADARMVFDADEHFMLEDGRSISVLDLKRGMRLRMGDGGVGTVTADPERRTEHPVPPLPSEEGLWHSRVVGQVKHTAYEIIHFRWAGQECRVTPGHVVWSEDRQWWIRAQELVTGEMVRVAGNVTAPVEGPGRVKTGPVEVFGIEVEYFHNYFVGRGPDAMLVHNGPECVGKPVSAAEEVAAPAQRQTLYHYTTAKGHEGITSSESLHPSLKAVNPKDARYGDGQYLSDIVPGTKTPGQLSYAFLNDPRGWRRFTHYRRDRRDRLDRRRGKNWGVRDPQLGGLEPLGSHREQRSGPASAG